MDARRGIEGNGRSTPGIAKISHGEFNLGLEGLIFDDYNRQCTFEFVSYCNAN
jgi:hypothetical protein